VYELFIILILHLLQLFMMVYLAIIKC